MKDLDIFDLLSSESLQVLKKLNPKYKKAEKAFCQDIVKVLAKDDPDVEELFSSIGVQKSSKKQIKISDWITYSYYEANLVNSEKVQKGHLVFAFINLLSGEKYYLAKRILLSKAGMDLDLSDQSFVQDLTEVAKKVAPNFIGRDKEMTRLIVNLSSQNEDRPTLLLGDSGSGKTSMMLELANRINSGLVPQNLIGTKVLRVKFGLLVNLIAFEKPGVQGDFFSRLISDILSNSKYKGKVVLFLDDLRMGSNFLISFGPINKKSGISIVGAAQNDLDEKFWESPAAKAWNIISIDEQPDNEILKILSNYAQIIQSKGNVEYRAEAISKIIDLYKHGYIDEGMPGGGIKLLEQLSIYKRHKNYDYNPSQGEVKIDGKLAKQKINLNSNFKKEDKNAGLESVVLDIEVIDDSDVMSYVDMNETDGAKKDFVFDAKKLLQLADNMKKEIIGQPVAVEALARALRVSSLKLNGESRPIATVLFLGPTGVGKTETAKALAKYLFGFRDKNKRYPANFYRADLSEYGEKHTVSKLFGAPPGYVGYEDSSSLSDFVREYPNSVVLFDEIDKAHPDVLNSILHIMDEGEIRNNKGEVVSFENVIIIMTSNHGAEFISRNEIGFNRTNSDWRESVMKNLKDKLKPEFINRFDEIIIFEKLTSDSIEKIIDIQIATLVEKLKSLNISLKFNKSVFSKLMKDANTDEYGARDIKRVVKKEILDPVSKILLENSDIKEISITKTGVVGK